MVAATLWAVASAAGLRSAGASERYAVVESLFLQRDNDSNQTPLVVDVDTGRAAIATPDLQFPVAGGVRAFVGRHGDGERGWELGYIGISGMSAVNSASGNGNLEIAPPLGNVVTSFSGASLARASDTSAINGAEANLLATSFHLHRPRDNAYAADRVPHLATIDWLAGFRWAGLDDQATISLQTPGARASQYGVRTTSNLFGGQVGVRGRIDWDRWGLEGWGKAALAGAALSQAQTPIIDAVTGEQYRPAWGGQRSDVGGIFDWNVTVVRHVGDRWSIRAGYTMLWLTGVALAPDQFDFSASPLAGTGVVGERMVWLQGATLGLEGRW